MEALEAKSILWTGIDTLKAGVGVYWGTDADMLWKRLASAQARARRCFNDEAAYVWPEQPRYQAITALTYGKKSFAKYGVQFNGMKIFFGENDEPENQTPNVYFEAEPTYIARRGLKKFSAFIKEFISFLGGEILWTKVSEAHLTTDLETNRPHARSDYYDWVNNEWKVRSRARVRCDGEEPESMTDHHYTYFRGKNLEGVRFGAGEKLLRNYDKIQELKIHPHKEWEKSLWTNPEAEHVIRVEFQLRTESLRNLGITSLDDLEKNLSGIWKHLTEDHICMVEVDDSNVSRRTITPFWKKVQSAIPGQEAIKLKKFFKATTRALAKQARGVLTTYLAMLGTAATWDDDEAKEMACTTILDGATENDKKPFIPSKAVEERQKKIKKLNPDYQITPVPEAAWDHKGALAAFLGKLISEAEEDGQASDYLDDIQQKRTAFLNRTGQAHELYWEDHIACRDVNSGEHAIQIAPPDDFPPENTADIPF